MIINSVVTGVYKNGAFFWILIKFTEIKVIAPADKCIFLDFD